jgi:hypothetical protein
MPIFNPRSARLTVPALGAALATIGVLCSFPQIADSAARSEAIAAAHRRIDTCLILADGRLIEGEIYVTRQPAAAPAKGDPNQSWYVEQKIGDGQAMCDLGAGTAQSKGSSAAFYRADKPADFRLAMAKRLGVEVEEKATDIQLPKGEDIDPALRIYKSDRWRPDYSKRKKAVPLHQKNILETLFTR